MSVRRFVMGPGKAGIIRRFPDEVRSLLNQGAETHLIVLMDADGDTFEDNRKLLVRKLTKGERARLTELGRFHLVCPNYELENWCRGLEGERVTEDRSLDLVYTHDKSGRDAGGTLAESCRKRQDLPHSLPSLHNACERWQAYLDRNDLR
jgi:hypothetical protein